MNSQASKSSLRIGTRGLLIATVVVAVLISTILYVRKPIRDARKIRPGDSAQRVHQLLGPPETTFESDAELRQSDLVPISFVFTDTTNTMSDVPASQLPMVSYRVEWFPMGPTAGHLVYYNDDGVEIVFWGGTQLRNRPDNKCVNRTSNHAEFVWTAKSRRPVYGCCYAPHEASIINCDRLVWLALHAVRIHGSSG